MAHDDPLCSIYPPTPTEILDEGSSDSGDEADGSDDDDDDDDDEEEAEAGEGRSTSFLSVPPVVGQVWALKKFLFIYVCLVF